MKENLAQENITAPLQPTKCSDLSPCDFFLLQKVKQDLKEHPFGTVANIEEDVKSFCTSQKKRSGKILNCVNNVGFAVSMPKGSISRYIKGICILLCFVIIIIYFLRIYSHVFCNGYCIHILCFLILSVIFLLVIHM